MEWRIYNYHYRNNLEDGMYGSSAIRIKTKLRHTKLNKENGILNRYENKKNPSISPKAVDNIGWGI